MSSFLGSGGMDPWGAAGVAVPDDERGRPETYKWNTGRRPAPWTDGLLWPSARTMGGDPGTALVPLVASPPWAALSAEETGGQSMKKIIGTTRDANGNPLGNCVVKGFLTVGATFLRSLTSDGGGYYEFCSENSGATHFLVAYLAGSPDVEGTTVNTLQPV